MNDRAMPMSVMDVIYRRRSARSYLPQKLDSSTIQALLEAAVRAPTAIHGEPWAFVVVQDKNLLRRLSDRAKKTLAEEALRIRHDGGVYAPDFFQQPEFNFFYNAGTLIVICGKSTRLFAAADCWLAAENLILAASSMKLGTCIIGSVISWLNSSAGKAELGVPPEYSVVAPIVVGVPGETAPPTSRKEPRIFAWK